MLGFCAQLLQSRHRGLARLAASVSDARLISLASVTTGVHVDGSTRAPCPLNTLDAAELERAAEAGDDAAVVAWHAGRPVRRRIPGDGCCDGCDGELDNYTL